MGHTLSSAITWWSNTMPDAKAVIMSGDSLTFRQYDDWASRIAARLIALGVKPGERVCVRAANSPAYCALILGIIRAGAIVLPMSLRLTAHEIREILEDTTPSLIIADEERAGTLVEAGVSPMAFDDVLALREGERVKPPLDLEPDAVVVIISTSGSTAKPKGVMFSHRSMLAYAGEYALQEPTATIGARVVVVAPFNTSAGFVQLIHYTTIGATIYIEPAFDAAQMLQLIQDEKITNFGGAPVFFERIAACPGFAQADLSSLILVTCGGARVTNALVEAYGAKDIVIRQIYGQTEIGGNGTIMPKDLAARYPEKCGRGGIFTQLRVVDNKGADCAPGEVGEILMRGPGMMVGYWNNPQATADTIRDGWLYSGDLGVLDEEGFLTFVDRKKDIIISGGLNISAAEVERAISDFAGVEEVVVIAAADDRFGETPMAVLFANRDISVADLISHCNTRLADYKVPRYVVVEADPLPRLATGKLSKPAVRSKYVDAVATMTRVR